MWGQLLPTMIDDVACEAFAGLGLQVLVTANNKRLVQSAVSNFTALPSAINGGVEGGIGLTPQTHYNLDHRPGTICQLWVAGTGNRARVKLEEGFAFRARQALMTTPTVAVFNALDAEPKFDISASIGQYGDGFETLVEQYNRKLISIPLMMGHDFLIEREIAYKEGVMGGFLWLFCDSLDHALAIGQKAVEAARERPGVGVIFGVCPSGSKLKSTNYPTYGPSTNQVLCPALRGKLSDSGVIAGVQSIPEIVFNAFDLQTLKNALKAVISTIQDEQGLIRISSRSFGNQLGNYSISLQDL
jgi:formylmethanofuran--tetrahydromethanopterin N-formyltransferase